MRFWKVLLVVKEVGVPDLDRNPDHSYPLVAQRWMVPTAMPVRRMGCLPMAGGVTAESSAHLEGSNANANVEPAPRAAEPARTEASGPLIGSGWIAGRSDLAQRFGRSDLYLEARRDTIAAVDGSHLRAARALLGWAMSDLAQVSGLSVSTIRRLEQNPQGVSLRNHRLAVQAMQAGGIRFLSLSDGTIALAPSAEPVPPAGAAGT